LLERYNPESEAICNLVLSLFNYCLHLYQSEKRGPVCPLFFLPAFLEGSMNIEQRVIELIEEKIADKPELFIVDVKFHPNGKLIILVDGDNGIAIQDCVAISRHVGFHLEEENTIEQAYNLEVSSPGIDAPLKLKRQYLKNVGRSLEIKKADGSKAEGKLLQVDDAGIMIEEIIKVKGKKAELIEATIPFDQITETKVLISFK
jgi:ribosome maturation factor RimP